MGKGAVSGAPIRTAENTDKSQKESYQLGLLTLNLGAVNRVPYIGGSKRFPAYVRKDLDARVLPHLVFRNSAHIVTLCEAHGDHGGIAVHQQLAHDHSMKWFTPNSRLHLSPFLSAAAIALAPLLNS